MFLLRLCPVRSSPETLNIYAIATDAYNNDTPILEHDAEIRPMRCATTNGLLNLAVLNPRTDEAADTASSAP